MIEEQDYYRLLGISPDASLQEIERAYRRLARRYHPDVNPAPDAHERMAAINQAYQVLRHPERRARYNARRRLQVRLEHTAPLVCRSGGLAAHWQHTLLTQQTAWRARTSRLLDRLVQQASFAYQAYGYAILQTLPRGPWITDLLLRRRQTYALARLHAFPLITRPHVQALLDELHTTDHVTGAYITTGFFTTSAQALAEAHRLPCYDGQTFASIYRQAAEKQKT